MLTGMTRVYLILGIVTYMQVCVIVQIVHTVWAQDMDSRPISQILLMLTAGILSVTSSSSRLYHKLVSNK